MKSSGSGGSGGRGSRRFFAMVLLTSKGLPIGVLPISGIVRTTEGHPMPQGVDAMACASKGVTGSRPLCCSMWTVMVPGSRP